MEQEWQEFSCGLTLSEKDTVLLVKIPPAMYDAPAGSVFQVEAKFEQRRRALWPRSPSRLRTSRKTRRHRS